MARAKQTKNNQSSEDADEGTGNKAKSKLHTIDESQEKKTEKKSSKSKTQLAKKRERKPQQQQQQSDSEELNETALPSMPEINLSEESDEGINKKNDESDSKEKSDHRPKGKTSNKVQPVNSRKIPLKKQNSKEKDDEDEPIEERPTRVNNRRKNPPKKLESEDVSDKENKVPLQIVKKAAPKIRQAKKKVDAPVAAKPKKKNKKAEADNFDEEMAGPSTSKAKNYNESDHIRIKVPTKNKKLRLRDQMMAALEHIIEEKKYCSVLQVEKYLRDQKEISIEENHQKIKKIINNLFDKEIIRQKHPKSKFSVMVQFVWNEKTKEKPLKRKSIIMAEKKMEQVKKMRAAKTGAEKGTPKATVKKATGKSIKPNKTVIEDEDEDETVSDSEDVPPKSRIH